MLLTDWLKYMHTCGKNQNTGRSSSHQHWKILLFSLTHIFGCQSSRNEEDRYSFHCVVRVDSVTVVDSADSLHCNKCKQHGWLGWFHWSSMDSSEIYRQCNRLPVDDQTFEILVLFLTFRVERRCILCSVWAVLSAYTVAGRGGLGGWSSLNVYQWFKNIIKKS